MELNVNDNYIVQSANYLNGIDAQRIPGASLANIDGTRMTSASQMLKHANRYSGPVASFDAEAGVKLKSLVANVTAWQEGSGDPAPDNVRPIHGWDGITLMHTGADILPDLDFTADYYIAADGTVTANSAFEYCDYFPVVPGDVYLITGSFDTNGYIRVHTYDSEKTWIEQAEAIPVIADTPKIQIITIPDDATYVRFSWPENHTFAHLMRDPHTEFVSWSDMAGTVYGGTIDITTGLLRVTHKIVDMGSLVWTRSGSSPNFYFRTVSISDGKQPDNTTDAVHAICSQYPIVKQSAWTVEQYGLFGLATTPTYAIGVKNDDYSDSAVFTASVSGQYLAYELETPLLYELDPTAIYTLEGINNIFADTGEIADAVVPFYPLEHIWQILY